MACTQTYSGLGLECPSDRGGIKAVYLCNFDDVTGVTMDASGETITAIGMASGAKWHPYYFEKETGTFGYTQNDTDNPNAPTFAATCSLVFSKLQTKARIEMMAMAMGRMRAIVEDVNGLCHLMGLNYPVKAKIEGTTGTAFGDQYGYNVELTSTEFEIPFSFAKSVFESDIEEIA